MTTARDLMASDPAFVQDTDTLIVAARAMRDLGRRAVPVCDGRQRLTGVLTERDIVIGCVAEGADPGSTTAGDVTDGVPVAVEADACIEGALQLMATQRVRRVPVVDDGRLVGDLQEAAVVVALPALAVELVRRPGA